MKASCLRWIITILMLLCIAVTVSSPAMAEEAGEAAVLPMDFTLGGTPAKPENWVYNGDLPSAYRDSSIEMTAERGTTTFKV